MGQGWKKWEGYYPSRGVGGHAPPKENFKYLKHQSDAFWDAFFPTNSVIFQYALIKVNLTDKTVKVLLTLHNDKSHYF